MKQKILVFIDHDIIIRHFILNNTFSELEKTYDIKYAISAAKKRINADIAKLPFKNEPIIIPFDQERLTKYRNLYRTAIMYQTYLNPAYKNTKDVWHALVGSREIFKRSILGHPLIYPYYNKLMMKRLGEDRVLKKLLLEEKPDVIIHPTVLEGIFVSDLIILAKRLMIPLVYIMNSWDNPSTKAMMVGYPDWLLAWGEQTQRHAREFIGIPRENIISFGAAQFDVYQRPPNPDPAEFKKSLGLDEKTLLILYAGSSNGFDEIEQLRLLEDGVKRKILPDCHVLFRPHPWRGSRIKDDDFFKYRFKHITMDPYMEKCYEISRREEKPDIYYQADYEKTNVVLKAASIVISGISSMMLEAVLLGKPVVCSAFDEHIEKNPILNKISKMYHFREFFDITGSIRSRRKEEFIEDCLGALKKSVDSLYTAQLKKKAAYFIEPFDKPYSVRLTELIDSICIKKKEDSCD